LGFETVRKELAVDNKGTSKVREKNVREEDTVRVRVVFRRDDDDDDDDGTERGCSRSRAQPSGTVNQPPSLTPGLSWTNDNSGIRQGETEREQNETKQNKNERRRL
jgi:hypothetical protein